MQMAWSARATCRLSRSASEYTATVEMPISLQARMTRMAISPRLAIRIFVNTCFHPFRKGAAAPYSDFTRAKENSALTHTLPFTEPLPLAK